MKRPINMPPQNSETYLLASIARHAGDVGLAEKIDDGAADGNFAADIHEDRQHAQNDVRIFQRADARLRILPSPTCGRWMKKKITGQHHEDDAKNQIGNLDRFRPVRAGFGKVLKDQIAADQRPDGGADGIESLRQIQAAGGGSFRAENRHVRIGGDLQHGKAESDDKQGRPETTDRKASWPPARTTRCPRPKSAGR